MIQHVPLFPWAAPRPHKSLGNVALATNTGVNDEAEDMLIEPRAPHQKYRSKEGSRLTIPDPGLFGLTAGEQHQQGPPLIGYSELLVSGNSTTTETSQNPLNEASDDQFDGFDLESAYEDPHTCVFKKHFF